SQMVEKTENDFDTVASSSRRADKVKPATTTRLAAIATSPAANKTENPPRQTPYEHLRVRLVAERDRSRLITRVEGGYLFAVSSCSANRCFAIHRSLGYTTRCGRAQGQADH
ncbi:hypothetical protein F441_03400, partial [Phytophthora nicotianae CJ01A1]